MYYFDFQACGLPLYWKYLLFNAAGGEKTGHITLQQFLVLWKKSVPFDNTLFLKREEI